MDNFAEYIWYLLPAVLKKNKAINQLYIFCKVLGSVFDDVKSMIFRLRRETMLETCSDCMLEVFAQDRNMFQMKGETYNQYRLRLQMKAQMAAMAGSLQGIMYALEAVGYADCKITPVYLIDPTRWSEINIDFFVESVDDPNEIDFKCIVDCIMHTKKASTLPHYIFHYPTKIQLQEDIYLSRITNRFTYNFFKDVLYLDGTWLLDGTHNFNKGFAALEAVTAIRTSVQIIEEFSEKVTIKHDLWHLDGTVFLDGSKLLDAYIKEEVL